MTHTNTNLEYLDELAIIFTGSKASPQEVAINTAADNAEGSGDDEDLFPPQIITLSPPCSELPLSPKTPVSVHPILLTPFKESPPQPLFAIEQLGVDRRLIVNRKRQLKMYRVWMQGIFRKI